jgi:hypothetical protein
MTRKRCRRTVWALINPITHAMTGAAITSTALLDQQRLMELSALEQFKKGVPSQDDWRIFADVSNVAFVMGESGIDPEVQTLCAQADAMLEACFLRYKKHSTIGRVAGEYEALAALWARHDQQRSGISRAAYDAAITKTANKIRGASPDVKVMI